MLILTMNVPLPVTISGRIYMNPHAMSTLWSLTAICHFRARKMLSFLMRSTFRHFIVTDAFWPAPQLCVYPLTGDSKAPFIRVV